jgi:hypothetical protein
MKELNGFAPVFFVGMVGVVLVELLKVASWKNTGKFTEKYSQPMYWIATAALLVVSGAVAALNGTEHVSALKAIQLGINAPAIVAGYASGSTSARRRKLKRAGFMSEGKVPPKPTGWQRLTQLVAWW